MPWSTNEALANIKAGPYTIGQGASGSEESVGELDQLALTAGYELSPIFGGAHYGSATVVDDGIKGVVVFGTFVLKQYDTQSLNRIMPLSTLTTGGTNKLLTLDLNEIVGRQLGSSAARVRLHKISVADLTDEYSDIIFPKGIVVPVGDSYDIQGEDSNMQPCMIRAYPDSNGYVIQWSANQT